MVLASGVELPQARIAEICRRYGVRELCVFGSALRQGMTPSDVDILVEFSPEVRVGIAGFARLNDELQLAIGRTVDLATKGGLKPWVRSSVLQEARRIYAA